MGYKIFKFFVRIIFFPLFRVKVIGKENLCIEGKAIVYANHVAAIDPFFIHAMMKRMPKYMAKKELFENKLVAWFCRTMGAFPVDRDHSDMSAVKTAFRILAEGEVLGIFPEGKRTLDGKMGPFHPGAAMIAVRAKAPMIPIYISRRMKPFHRTYFIIGKPFDITEKLKSVTDADPKSIINATDIARNEILLLKENFEKECQR